MTQTTQRSWTFVLTGEARSGAAAVLTAINARRGAVCYSDLFHPDAAARRAAHEAAFGPSGDPVRAPEWYVDGHTNPWQYLTRTVLVPRSAEPVVGCYLGYGVVRRLELYDLFEDQARAGGFSVVQVVRNPVACFVSLKQAQQSGVWTRPRGEAVPPTPLPVRINPDELTAFCRDHAATVAKIRATCEDRLEISYRDLVFNYQAAMRRVFDHIELPEVPALAQPACARLRNRAFDRRVTNWPEVRLGVPADVKALIASEDLL